VQTIKWYQSKIVWLGVVTTLIGALQLLVPVLQANSFAPADITTLVIGVLTIISRIWFTDSKIA
jgi:hypothetical protein